eukprot:CAMPEP_0116828924 /NCGR_PEP_ID=MMETSP0418-20121206/3913_1 /TAXON_ID=1158023 /ORGANISM="Astrosyne radiata, Strain 13vi08-1A" /LENGTH=321 /DNA_ID=CAMNT_0004457841 /DNA_START=152 /DNA_END=1114 /DNA_ORIENTATION=+
MIELIDATSTSLTVSWPAVPGASCYKLQYRTTGSSEDDFLTLSDKLTSTQARKKNLEDPSADGFKFRVGTFTDGEVKEWVSHEGAFHLLPEKDESERMEAPEAVPAGTNRSLLIKWTTVNGASGFELQMRENTGGAPWKTIAPSLSGTEVRKKNLVADLGYQFRVRPTGSDSAFSSPSGAVAALGLGEGIKRLFNSLEDGNLLQGPNKAISLEDALGGKEFVLLYASAHWCSPCRQFTPMLTKWYQSLTRKNVEVVFLSADHDERGFESYFQSMPWLAVPFDDETRENLMGYIRVTGIPRLVVLDGRTGRILVDNAVGQSL